MPHTFIVLIDFLRVLDMNGFWIRTTRRLQVLDKSMLKLRWCTALFKLAVKKHLPSNSDLRTRHNEKNPSHTIMQKKAIQTCLVFIWKSLKSVCFLRVNQSELTNKRPQRGLIHLTSYAKGRDLSDHDANFQGQA